jgi:hypothetical protein
MNKTDQWLIKNWAKATNLESAMRSARQHHKELFDEVHRLVKRDHNLDCCDIHFEADRVNNIGGEVCFSNSDWPHLPSYKTWRTGIYLWRVSLDELTNERDFTPEVYIWFAILHRKTNNRENKQLEILRKRLAAKAPSVFKKRNINWKSDNEEDNRICISYPLPEKCSQLRELLLKDNGRGFVECIASHVKMMAGFKSVLDEVLTK